MEERSWIEGGSPCHVQINLWTLQIYGQCPRCPNGGAQAGRSGLIILPRAWDRNAAGSSAERRRHAELLWRPIGYRVSGLGFLVVRSRLRLPRSRSDSCAPSELGLPTLDPGQRARRRTPPGPLRPADRVAVARRIFSHMPRQGREGPRSSAPPTRRPFSRRVSEPQRPGRAG